MRIEFGFETNTVPGPEMSGPARAFAQAILKANEERRAVAGRLPSALQSRFRAAPFVRPGRAAVDTSPRVAGARLPVAAQPGLS